MLIIIISLQSEDLQVCELSTIVLDISSEYPFFSRQSSDWIPRNSIPQSECIKTLGHSFGTQWIKSFSHIFTECSQCTTTQSNKIGWARVTGAGTIISRIYVCRALCRWTPAHLPEPCITLDVLTQSAHLKEHLELQPNHLGNMDSPKQIFLTFSCKRQYRST